MCDNVSDIAIELILLKYYAKVLPPERRGPGARGPADFKHGGIFGAFQIHSGVRSLTAHTAAKERYNQPWPLASYTGSDRRGVEGPWRRDPASCVVFCNLKLFSGFPHPQM